MDAIRKVAPGLLAVSIMNTEHACMRSAIAKLRAALPELNILAGGPHPTFVPSCVDDLAVEGICVGEGDNVVLYVLERCGGGRDWDGIPNIHTRTSKNPP